MPPSASATARIFLIADLHLNRTTGTELLAFGDYWRDHLPKMAERWDPLVGPDDIVLVPGDISWAPRATAVGPDLEWIAERPGHKLLSVGNHDRWWRSEKHMTKMMPDTVETVHERWIPFGKGVVAATMGSTCPGDVFFSNRDKGRWPDRVREVKQLRSQLEELRAKKTPPAFAILMIHYPPFNGDGEPSEISMVIEEAGIDLCVYGHFHQEKEWRCTWNEERNGVRYAFGASDARDFTPIHVADLRAGVLVPVEVPMPIGPRELWGGDFFDMETNA